MPSVCSFHTAFHNLSERMKARAEADGDIYLPNPELGGQVSYVLITMEPSLGGGSPEQTRARVNAGFRNFLYSIDDFILHFCVRRYLCRPTERYHITDWSKGAMSVKDAHVDRGIRYDRWYPFLLEEIDLVAPDARIIAVGHTVAEHFVRRGFDRPFTRILHYSSQAARARKEGIIGREERYEAFKDTVSLDAIIATANDVLWSLRMPEHFCHPSLDRLRKSKLTDSRKRLIFIYKEAFEAMNPRS